MTATTIESQLECIASSNRSIVALLEKLLAGASVHVPPTGEEKPKKAPKAKAETPPDPEVKPAAAAPAAPASGGTMEDLDLAISQFLEGAPAGSPDRDARIDAIRHKILQPKAGVIKAKECSLEHIPAVIAELKKGPANFLTPAPSAVSDEV